MLDCAEVVKKPVLLNYFHAYVSDLIPRCGEGVLLHQLANPEKVSG
jgi:hypothetical protein